jgi:hypothetical protein
MIMLKTLFSGAASSTDAPVDRLTLRARLKAAFGAGDSTQKADEIGAYIEAHGGVLTDDIERAISRRFGHMAGK